MALRIKYRPTEELVPYAQNPRTHTEAQVDQIARSIEEYGWTNPILVDEDGGIVAGHGRLLAALKMGLDKVPTILLAELTPEQRKAYVIADNQLALNAGWDNDTLAAELGALAATDYDLSLLGFSEAELLKVLGAAEGLTDPDDVPEAPKVPKTKPGDLWILGDHRLLCGDATSEEDVTRVLDGAVPNLMVTDPPYGVNYDPAWRDRAAAKGQIAYAASRVGEVKNDDRADWKEAYALHPGSVIYSWAPAGPPQLQHGAALEAAGFELRMQMIWAKSHIPIGRGHYHVRHEPCWYAVRKDATAGWIGDRSQNTLWEAPLDKNVEGGHSTQKPVECMARPIRNHEGDVYDPFVGSGTTLIAAEMLARRCYAMEIAPVYVDVAVTRWENFTGKTAVLDG